MSEHLRRQSAQKLRVDVIWSPHVQTQSTALHRMFNDPPLTFTLKKKCRTPDIPIYFNSERCPFPLESRTQTSAISNFIRTTTLVETRIRSIWILPSAISGVVRYNRWRSLLEYPLSPISTFCHVNEMELSTNLASESLSGAFSFADVDLQRFNDFVRFPPCHCQTFFDEILLRFRKFRVL